MFSYSFIMASNGNYLRPTSSIQSSIARLKRRLNNLGEELNLSFSSYMTHLQMMMMFPSESIAADRMLAHWGLNLDRKRVVRFVAWLLSQDKVIQPNEGTNTLPSVAIVWHQWPPYQLVFRIAAREQFLRMMWVYRKCSTYLPAYFL